MSDNASKGRKIIRICCSKPEYNEALSSPSNFKEMLDQEIARFPELFPNDIANGYILSGKTRPSKKLGGIKFQKIKIESNNDVYSVYPSFVMPNLIAYTDEIEKALMLRKHDVPYSTLAYIFGRNEMFWYRAEKTFSNCSIVGTTVKKKKICPPILQLMKSTANFAKKRFTSPQQ